MARDRKVEIQSLLEDVSWRINSLFWIENELGQKVKFRLNDAQRSFWEEMHWLNVILKSRQHGMSTVTNLMQLDQCLFNPNQTCGIVDKTDPDAKKKLQKIRFAYEHLDDTDDPVTAKLGAAIKEAVKLVKANDHELEWSNGSKIWTGTSLRGGTVQFLHISELGPIAFNNPRKAEEIRAGALNTIHKGAKVVIESTHEGGKFGLNYEMIQLAQHNNGKKDLTAMDWKFHFFAWWQDPKNRLPVRGMLSMPRSMKHYFEELEKSGIILDDDQQHWYLKKEMTQRHAMYKEHPSTPEEALNAIVKGAIYGRIISEMRREGRLKPFGPDLNKAIWTFWDLGQSDYTAIWVVQFIGMEIALLEYFACRGQGARFYASKIEEWEGKYGTISSHFLPHDAANRVGPGVTWISQLQDAGLKNLKVVPRTPDVWIGINHLRGLLPRCWINTDGCDQEWELDGQIIPSGVSCLEGYHTKEISKTGTIREEPEHDETSHGCDALRTMAEAHLRGMLEGTQKIERGDRAKPKVITGLSYRRNKPRVRVRM